MANRKELGKLLERALAEKQFRVQLLRNASGAAVELGITLTPAQLKRLCRAANVPYRTSMDRRLKGGGMSKVPKAVTKHLIPGQLLGIGPIGPGPRREGLVAEVEMLARKILRRR